MAGDRAIWYFLTRKGLIDYARAGNIEMVTPGERRAEQLSGPAAQVCHRLKC